jgi:hypothetical protein
MKAIVQDRYGPPTEVLRLAEIEKPVVGDGDVLIQVRAAGVNPADWHLPTGWELQARRGDFDLPRTSFSLTAMSFFTRSFGSGLSIGKCRDPGVLL